jgi:hypothetical protein
MRCGHKIWLLSTDPLIGCNCQPRESGTGSIEPNGFKTMSEKGWLRKRPLRESSPNLLPLHQSNKTNTTAFRPAASSSAFSVQCYEASSGKPPLQSSSQQKYHHEREHNRGTYPTRLSKSFSLSSLVGMTTQQSNSGEACIPNIRSNSSETSLCHPSIATGPL